MAPWSERCTWVQSGLRVAAKRPVPLKSTLPLPDLKEPGRWAGVGGGMWMRVFVWVVER